MAARYLLGSLFSFAVLLAPAPAAEVESTEDAASNGWVRLFDGESLDGWRASENPESFSVKDGTIDVDGPRGHLFYVGEVANADFRNFEFRCQVKTWPGANSGIYFHTKYQEEGWPQIGYEAQVNNSQSDPKRTGGLYAVDDVYETPVQDNEWFDYYISVRGKRIVIKINGETTVDYSEPDDLDRTDKRLDSGTFAFQAHDPGSHVAYRNIMVKVLDD